MTARDAKRADTSAERRASRVLDVVLIGHPTPLAQNGKEKKKGWLEVGEIVCYSVTRVTYLSLGDAAASELVVVREEVLDADAVLVHAVLNL